MLAIHCNELNELIHCFAFRSTMILEELSETISLAKFIELGFDLV